MGLNEVAIVRQGIGANIDKHTNSMLSCKSIFFSLQNCTQKEERLGSSDR
jgi:hypothetical protein